MGKQIGFFMGPEDEKKFIELVLSQQDLLIRIKLKEGEIDPVKDPLNTNDSQLFIVSRQAKIIAWDSGFIKGSESDVIEFDRCKRDSNKIKVGRLWMEMKYWDKQEQLITKEKWFNDRFEFYRRWLKKKYRISKNKGYYIGEEAYELYREGKSQMIIPATYIERVVEFD